MFKNLYIFLNFITQQYSKLIQQMFSSNSFAAISATCDFQHKYKHGTQNNLEKGIKVVGYVPYGK